MKLKNKIILIAAVLMFVICAPVFAEEIHNSLKISFDSGEIPTVKEQDVTFALFDASGAELYDSKTQSIKRGERYFDIEFSTPEYTPGTNFMLKMTAGEGDITFDGVTAKEHSVHTYSTTDETGEVVCHTSFQMNFNPAWNYEAVIKIPAVKQTLFYHYPMENEVFVTTDLLSVLGISCETAFDAEKPNFTLFVGDKRATFYVNDIYATFGGVGENLSSHAFVANEMPFVPLSRVAEYFECNYVLVKEDEYHREITLTLSIHSAAYKNAQYVNSIDITSKTDYLVWVDKSEYTVNVYLGSNKNWRLIESFPCAIGAPGTPTIEGSFEYYQYQDRWQYNGYYCGPVMRFKGGYALHSVLIRNNGTFYDGRVKAKISHGCVRMLPDDIKWMVDFVPLYTRILVTA